MFLAYVRKYYPRSDKPDEHLTYTCKDRSEHELITLLSRFRFMWNELNPDDRFEFQLLYLTDLSSSVRLQDALELGAIEITKTELDSMRSKMIEQRSQLNFQQKMQETWAASAKVTPETEEIKNSENNLTSSSFDEKLISETPANDQCLTSEDVANILAQTKPTPETYGIDEGVTGE